MNDLLNFFITNAYAAPEGADQAGGGYTFFIIMGAFFLLMYFTMIRPQQKRAKEQQTLVNSIEKGDEVITAGGFLGKITKIKDQYISLSLANNVEILLQKNSIVSVLPQGTIKSLE